MKLRMEWKAGKKNMGLTESIKKLKDREVRAGVGGPHAYLARIHEFGCRVPVTPKMRAYLHHLGVHLKKETAYIVIPERAFLRNGYDAVRGEMGQQAAKLIKRVVGGGEARLEELGRALAEGLRGHAKAGVPPTKKAFPGVSATPALTDTGAMLNGVDYEISPLT